MYNVKREKTAPQLNERNQEKKTRTYVPNEQIKKKLKKELGGNLSRGEQQNENGNISKKMQN